MAAQKVHIVTLDLADELLRKRSWLVNCGRVSMTYVDDTDQLHLHQRTWAGLYSDVLESDIDSGIVTRRRAND